MTSYVLSKLVSHLIESQGRKRMQMLRARADTMPNSACQYRPEQAYHWDQDYYGHFFF